MQNINLKTAKDQFSNIYSAVIFKMELFNRLKSLDTWFNAIDVKLLNLQSFKLSRLVAIEADFSRLKREGEAKRVELEALLNAVKQNKSLMIGSNAQYCETRLQEFVNQLQTIAESIKLQESLLTNCADLLNELQAIEVIVTETQNVLKTAGDLQFRELCVAELKFYESLLDGLYEKLLNCDKNLAILRMRIRKERGYGYFAFAEYADDLLISIKNATQSLELH